MADIILDIAHDAVGVLSLPSSQHYVEWRKSKVAFIGEENQKNMMMFKEELDIKHLILHKVVKSRSTTLYPSNLVQSYLVRLFQSLGLMP
jgi:predicted GH43/DUF377 family glycosyl hydrolase